VAAPDRSLESFAVICFQKETILQVARTGAERCLLVLSHTLLAEVRREEPEPFREIWQFRQRPGFKLMDRYKRETLVLLGEKVRWKHPLAFPDMRALEDGGER
jgi:hypothetical protein